MPSFGPNMHWLDVLLILGFVLFIVVTKKAFSGPLAVGICLLAAGAIGLLTRRFYFRTYSQFHGGEALVIGVAYILLGLWLVITTKRKSQKGTDHGPGDA